jgi:tetratricopeptide (TPR) repeat protein
MKKIMGCIFLWLSLSILLLGCAENKAIVKKRAEAKKDIGMANIKQGDFQGGISELLEALEMDPTNADIQNSIGHTYHLYLRDFNRAVFHFKKALALRPEFPAAQNNLGTVYLDLGKWDMAIELFTKAVNNHKYRTRHTAYNNIGMANHQKGDYRRAIENYKKALGLSPKLSPAYDNMGYAYENLREYDLAIRAYKKSIEYSPDMPISHLRLGGIYLKLNRHEEAAQEFIKTINSDSKGRYAEEARLLLEQVKISE